jgi:antitoxin component YwqK of YwqJK toxin-antitoxin module
VRICKTNSLGKKNGIYKSYYYDGQLCEEVNYINDKKNGIYKSYYSNGQLFSEVNYIDGA